MKKAQNLLWEFVQEESGQDLVEYALIVAMVSLGAVAGLSSLANAIANVPNSLMQTIYNAYSS